MSNNESGKARQYEVVATELMNRFCADFNLSMVEGKQHVTGQVSGTDWEIDAKGVTEDGTGFLVVECKRHMKSNVPQAIVAALAYTIADTGAAGGFIVNPLDLQEGAKKVANASNITHVRLDDKSTPLEFKMQFLDKLFVGFHASITITEELTYTLLHADGTIETTKVK